MRILLALAIVLAGCSKKASKEEEAKPAEPKTAEAPKQPATPAPTTPAPPAPVADDDEKPTPTESAPAVAAPTKEAGIQRLKDVLAALEAKDWTKAATFFAWPAAERPRSPEAALGKLVELKEISAKGIEILAAKGKWGKLAEVIEPDRAASLAEKYALPVDECYGFSMANATVGFHWDGQSLQLIRLNNVGKLE